MSANSITIPLPDYYSLRARFAPAAIAVLPAIAAGALLVPWDGFSVSHAVAATAIAILLWVFSDFARSQGKRIEPILEELQGGQPSTVMLRHRDTRFDAATKQRFLAFIGKAIEQTPPTAAEESADPAAADIFYKNACAWLRAQTYDTKRFRILFGENITYGFRRNLLGLKRFALAVNLCVVIAVGAVLYWWAPHDVHAPIVDRMLIVLIVAGVHALYVLFIVTWRSAIKAAETYARQLILSTEELMKPKPATRPRKPKQT